MVFGVYTVMDVVAEQAGPLYLAVNDATALRQYRGLLQQVTPADRDAYKLYRLGSYNDQNMVLSGSDPVHIEMAVQPDLDLIVEGKE